MSVVQIGLFYTISSKSKEETVLVYLINVCIMAEMFHLIPLNNFRYAPDKLFITKIEKGSISVNTVDRGMIFKTCTSSYNHLSLY